MNLAIKKKNGWSSETNESRGTRKMFGECHAHIIMDGVNYRHAIDLHRNGPDDNVIREHLKIYQDRGITFVRDGGMPLEFRRGRRTCTRVWY